MATISFETFEYGNGSCDVFAYTNEYESTIIKDYFDYERELKQKQEEAKNVGRTVQGEIIKSVLIIKWSYSQKDFQDLFSLLNEAIKIKLDDPERESKIKNLLPFVDKWDVSNNTFNKELWEETEFLSLLRKDNHNYYTLSKETKSGRVLSSNESVYDKDND